MATVYWDDRTLRYSGNAFLDLDAIRKFTNLERTTLNAVASSDMSSIIQATFDQLPLEFLLSRRIARFRLTNYFNVVELDDGSVGAAVNYADGSSHRLRGKEHAFASLTLVGWGRFGGPSVDTI